MTTPAEPTIPAVPVVPVDAAAVAAAAAAAEAAKNPAPLNLDPPEVVPPVIPGADGEVVEVEYAPTGDTGLDLALAFVGKRGFGDDHAAIKAATKGDFGPLEVALKALGDKAKGYDRYLQVAKDSFGRKAAATASAADATRKVVEAAAGGADQWAAIQQWAAANADPDEKVQINAALKAGGTPARLIVAELAKAYAASGESTAKPKSATKPEASSAGAGGDAPLSPEEYRKVLADLSKKYGHRLQDKPEFQAARARRLAYNPK